MLSLFTDVLLSSFFFFDYLVSAEEKQKDIFSFSHPHPLRWWSINPQRFFLNFLRALYDLERETGESVNRLSNANHGTVITLYMSSCTGSVISYSQTV